MKEKGEQAVEKKNKTDTERKWTQNEREKKTAQTQLYSHRHLQIGS